MALDVNLARTGTAGMGNAAEVVRKVSVHDFRAATEQQFFHLDYRLLRVSPGAVGI
jgi:hypothetical protein